MKEVKLGKIKSVKLGPGGYDDAMFGVSFELGGDDWGVIDFRGTWETRSDHAKFSEEDWKREHTDAYFRIMRIMKEAKVRDLSQLKNIPVEVTIERMKLYSWRILTEVL